MNALKTVLSLVLCGAVIPVLASKLDSEYKQARLNGAEAKFELHVVDDTGTSVDHAKIRVFMGMNYREKGYWLDGETDANGIWALQGKTCGNEIEIWISKDGYYNSNHKMSLATMGAEHEVQKGKWLPWGKEERIVLRKIRNPIELIRYDIVLQVPATNAWIGFDMRKGGFVAPYGNGVMSDFKINVDWDGVVKPQSKHCEMDISFPGEENGFYFERKTLESEYANVMATSPLKGYDKSSLIWTERKDGVYLREKSVWNGYDAVARLRSVTDEQGKLISAHYADIRKMEVSPSKRGCPLLSLSYVFNPTPNDTNLESKR